MEALILIIIIVVAVYFVFYEVRQYKRTSYFEVTKNPYGLIRSNKGMYGEYLLYRSLQHFEETGGKFLFNLYIPRSNNETTEIDVLLICSKGLFVFESKNYDGWIFGNEADKYWTQTLPRGYRGGSHKERFYNPIRQNESHVRHLNRLVDSIAPTYSIIVFSDNSTLKNVTIRSGGVKVVNCRKVSSAVDEIYNRTPDCLSPVQIDHLYYKLHSYTQVSSNEKERHIERVQRF